MTAMMTKAEREALTDHAELNRARVVDAASRRHRSDEQNRRRYQRRAEVLIAVEEIVADIATLADELEDACVKGLNGDPWRLPLAGPLLKAATYARGEYLDQLARARAVIANGAGHIG